MVVVVSKVILFGSVVVVIGAVAQRYPAWGGYLAVFPSITLLSLAALLLERQPAAVLSSFLQGALFGVILTSLALFFTFALLRSGTPAHMALILGGSVWIAVTVLVGRLVF